MGGNPLLIVQLTRRGVERSRDAHVLYLIRTRGGVRGGPAYPIPPGLHAIPHHLLDLRSDAEIGNSLLYPPLALN